MANLFSITDQRYDTRKEADLKFATKGDLSYIHTRIDEHTNNSTVHFTVEQARAEFPTRREIAIRETSSDRELAELKRIVLRIESLLDRQVKQN